MILFVVKSTRLPCDRNSAK